MTSERAQIIDLIEKNERQELTVLDDSNSDDSSDASSVSADEWYQTQFSLDLFCNIKHPYGEPISTNQEFS